MTQKDKKLLLKDLCARLPYGVKVKHGGIPCLLISIKNDRNGIKIIIESSYGEHVCEIEDIKPYLRHSLTAEEREEISHYENPIQIADFYYSRHIDCMYMIEKGLATEAPEDMYNV